MDPFHIQCRACAARLKVRNPSAIGQKLACPKCGEMILVENQKTSVGDSGLDNTVGASDSDFGDIDQILQSKSLGPTDAPQPKVKQAPKVKAPDKQPEAETPISPNLNDDISPPLLPNENWTGETSRRRNKQLTIFAIAAGLIIVGVAVTLAIMNFQSDRIASNSSNQSDNPEPVVDGQNQNESPGDSNIESTESTPPQPPETDETGETNATDNPNPKDNNLEEVVDPSPAEPTDSIVDSSEEKTTTVKSPEKQMTFESDLDSLLGQTNTKADSSKSNFDELSKALKQSGTSLFEINQLAAVNALNRRIGFPKYYIEKPNPIDPKWMNNLSEKCAGVQFSGQSLNSAIAEICTISGVPIAFNVDPLVFAEFKFDAILDNFKITDSTFQEVVDQIIKLQGDQFELRYDGINPAIIGRTQEVSETKFHPIPTLNSKSPKDLVELIQTLIFPVVWQKDEFWIKNSGEQLEVKASPKVQRLISQFLDQWNLCASGESNQVI